MSENFLSSLPVDEKFEPKNKLKETWKASMDDPEGFWSRRIGSTGSRHGTMYWNGRTGTPDGSMGAS
jgi:hypothetical protein